MPESSARDPQFSSCVETTFAAAEVPLHQAAVAAAGSEDFGDPAYLDGLRVLLRAYDEEAKHTPVGRIVAEQMTIGLLAARLRTQAQLKTLDQAAVDAVRRPIFITGLIRTGSTALYHLIGADSGLHVLPYWLTLAPQARPPRDQWEAHPDFRQAASGLDLPLQRDRLHQRGPRPLRHPVGRSSLDVHPDCSRRAAGPHQPNRHHRCRRNTRRRRPSCAFRPLYREPGVRQPGRVTGQAAGRGNHLAYMSATDSSNRESSGRRSTARFSISP